MKELKQAQHFLVQKSFLFSKANGMTTSNRPCWQLTRFCIQQKVVILLRSCLVAGLRKYGSLDLVLTRSLSSNLHLHLCTYLREWLLFALKGEISVPLAVQLGIDEDVFIVEDSLSQQKVTVQLSLVGTQTDRFESYSTLSSIDPRIYLYNIMMQESQSSEWKKRRSIKKDKNYECGCGKRYKVFASLESHIKTLHAGVSPGPIKLPEKCTRGRPKQNTLQEFAAVAEDTTNPLHLLAALRQGWLAGKNVSLKEVYEREPVYQLIARFQYQKKELKFIEEDCIFQVTMGRGILMLLEELRHIVEDQQYQDELVMLITTYISYVIEQTEDQNVLSNGCIGLLPQFANYFLLYDFERRCQRIKIKNLWINVTANVIEVFSIIFRWLVFKKFTHTRATVNRDFLAEKTKPQQIKPDSV